MRKYDIMPRPVTYKNIDFRSTLEARWAVFFDTLQVKWEYEKTYFKTSLGGYLPDFFLATGWIVEIKPTLGTPAEIIKAREVSLDGLKIAIVSGQPDVYAITTMFFDGQMIRIKPSYWQEISAFWGKRPRYVLDNLLALQELTRKRNFTKAFNEAKGFRFDER